MKDEKYIKVVLRVSAVFLWYFTPLFLLIVSGIVGRLFPDDILIVRHPYQWDYELMFAGFFLVWGIFVWKAAKNPEMNLSFIKFTAWGFFAIVLTNILVGLFKTADFIHLANDSIPWFILGLLIFIMSKKYDISKT
jgi:hypothetical protein